MHETILLCEEKEPRRILRCYKQNVFTNPI